MNRYKNIIELLDNLKSKYGDICWSRIKYINDYVPINERGILKETGNALEVFDEFGGYIGSFKGFCPINGGNVVYLDCY